MKISSFSFWLKIFFACIALSILPISVFAAPADDFVTTWRTTTAGESIAIPTLGAGYNYGFDCNNDNVFE